MLRIFNFNLHETLNLLSISVLPNKFDEGKLTFNMGDTIL